MVSLALERLTRNLTARGRSGGARLRWHREEEAFSPPPRLDDGAAHAHVVVSGVGSEFCCLVRDTASTIIALVGVLRVVEHDSLLPPAHDGGLEVAVIARLI